MKFLKNIILAVVIGFAATAAHAQFMIGLPETNAALPNNSDNNFPTAKAILSRESARQNSSAVPQTPAAATRTYITGSKLAIPSTGLRVGTVFRWRFNMTKTAAGIATSTFDIAFGTAGTTSDTARVSFTKPAGTAAADEGWVEIECVIKAVNASTGVAVGQFTLIHNLASTGHAQIPCVVVSTTSSNFNTVTPTYVGLCITSGASDAITINQVSATATNL